MRMLMLCLGCLTDCYCFCIVSYLHCCTLGFLHILWPWVGHPTLCFGVFRFKKGGGIFLAGCWFLVFLSLGGVPRFKKGGGVTFVDRGL